MRSWFGHFDWDLWTEHQVRLWGCVLATGCVLAPHARSGHAGRWLEPRARTACMRSFEAFLIADVSLAVVPVEWNMCVLSAGFEGAVLQGDQDLVTWLQGGVGCVFCSEARCAWHVSHV